MENTQIIVNEPIYYIDSSKMDIIRYFNFVMLVSSYASLVYFKWYDAKYIPGYEEKLRKALAEFGVKLPNSLDKKNEENENLRTRDKNEPQKNEKNKKTEYVPYRNEYGQLYFAHYFTMWNYLILLVYNLMTTFFISIENKSSSFVKFMTRYHYICFSLQTYIMVFYFLF